MALRNLTSPESIHKIGTEELRDVKDLALSELWLRGSWELVRERARELDSSARNFKACVEHDFGGIEETWRAARKGDKGAEMLLSLMMDCFEDPRFVDA